MSVKDRLKSFIESKKSTISAFEQSINASNGYVNSIYKSIGLDKLLSIVEKYLDLNLNWLISEEGSMLLTDTVKDLGVDGLTIVSEPGLVYHKATEGNESMYEETDIEELVNKSGNKFLIHPDGRMEIEVALMNEPAYASYMEQYFDEEYLQDLRTEKFDVDSFGKGSYLSFVIKNNSMWNGGEYDTKGGSKLLGREIKRDLWPVFYANKYGFILMTEKGIFHKDIKGYDETTGELTLSSRNPDVEDFRININEVRKIYKVIKSKL